MAKKPETHVVTDIRDWVINYGGKVLKTHGDAMSEIGTPDLLGSIIVLAPYAKSLDGEATYKPVRVPFVVEVKMPGEKSTPIQDLQLVRWNNAGMFTAVVRSLDEFVKFIDTVAISLGRLSNPPQQDYKRYYKAKYHD